MMLIKALVSAFGLETFPKYVVCMYAITLVICLGYILSRFFWKEKVKNSTAHFKVPLLNFAVIVLFCSAFDPATSTGGINFSR